MMTGIFIGLALGAGGFAAANYLLAAPAGKFAWLDRVRALFGKKP